MPEESTTNEDNNEVPKLQYEWMIRPCNVYDEEYGDCRSIRGRLHQRFVHGSSVDCSQWKRDYDNCVKWEEKKDLKAANELIKSEINRRKERLQAHIENDVWGKRKEPPSDWNRPLPEEMVKQYENTYLHIKNQEMKGEIPPTIDSKCSIM
ncbi:PREDICTED: UPF0545 protein C22orf39 homolog [Nicrophorus vespilloides]|uniref:Synaptic plasticity regulator PANTS n=1 Tax=Nicrophorus vespilloides TaxID=110193 RepID=A0ABM1MWK4_NICVS|nr:PREDICTED: UPF0545 protein C22orf39 homolog [Nicrophorus vespilloides]